MITNNYYAITLDDYQVLKDLAPLKRYNHVAVLSEQVVEKKPEDCSTGQHTDHNIEYWIFQHLFPILIHYLLFRFPIFISYGFSCIKSIRYKSFRAFFYEKSTATYNYNESNSQYLKCIQYTLTANERIGNRWN